MQASLQYLAKWKNTRKIAVLGDMLELGEYAQNLHEQVGKEVYQNKMDILICMGENAQYIVKGAKEAGMLEENIYYLKNIKQIENKITECAKAGDVILLKASNGMRFFDIVENLKEVLLCKS